MTWATSQHSWERSRQSRALLGTEHGAEGLPRLPAQPRRNGTRSAPVGWAGAAEGRGAIRCPSESSLAPPGEAEPGAPTLAGAGAAVGEQPGSPARGPANRRSAPSASKHGAHKAPRRKLLFQAR